MKTKNSHKSAFTLIELLISIGVFAVLATLAATAFTSILRMQKRVAVENQLLQDSKLMMEQLSNLVRTNTIDYEEYYNQKVLKTFIPNANYGDNYGYYATMFYKPNQNVDVAGGNPPNDSTNAYYGAYYNDSVPATMLCRISLSDRKLELTPSDTATYRCPPDTTVVKKPQSSDILLDGTIDYNTGQNPFPDTGILMYSASAFCDDLKGVPCTNTGIATPYNDLFLQNELYLIDQSGFTKTIIAKEKITDSQAVISQLQLSGSDQNFNEIADEWRCADNYNCTGLQGVKQVPDQADLTKAKSDMQDIFDDFIPISPLSANIVDLKFYLRPLEDPRKAFNENEKFGGLSLPEFMMQPNVTIVLTMEPSDHQGFADGELPQITLQTTISSRVLTEVKSYGP